VPYKGEYPLVEVAAPPKKAKLLKGKKWTNTRRRNCRK
jgi:hypothetical protein